MWTLNLILYEPIWKRCRLCFRISVDEPLLWINAYNKSSSLQQTIRNILGSFTLSDDNGNGKFIFRHECSHWRGGAAMARNIQIYIGCRCHHRSVWTLPFDCIKPILFRCHCRCKMGTQPILWRDRCCCRCHPPPVWTPPFDSIRSIQEGKKINFLLPLSSLSVN